MAKEDLTYNVIIHPIRESLGLSLLQYCIADSIYHLSNNPKSIIMGWCYASKISLGKLMGVTERCIFDNLKVLMDKKLIEKNEDSRYLRTTSKWYENVVLVRAKKEYEEISGCMKKVQGGYEKSSAKHYEKIAYNSNKSYSNINNKTRLDKPTTPRKSTSFPKEDYDSVLEAYQKLRDITLQGKEYDPVMQTIKTMFISERSVEDIIGCMNWLASGEEEWMENWTINTVKMKIPFHNKGQGELKIPNYAKNYNK